MNTKKYFVFFFIFLFVSFGVNAQKLSLFLGGGFNFVSSYGSIDDYVAGENDFPVTPSHKTAMISFSADYKLFGNFGVMLSADYYLSSSVELSDPSDGDTVNIDTSPHFGTSLNIFYSFNSGVLKSFFYIGGGFDKLFSEDKVYTSNYGYEIVFLSPERTIDPLFNMGGGVDFNVFSLVYMRLKVAYTMIFSEPATIKSMSFSLGFCVKL